MAEINFASIAGIGISIFLGMYLIAALRWWFSAKKKNDLGDELDEPEED